MKYPAHTNSTPVSGKQAVRVLNAINNGGSISNPYYDETIKRILDAKEAKSRKDSNGERKSKIHSH
jgi:hypothetical protein